ncbi:MAG: OmpA family protein [Thermonemataceae bacterium]|nr:OmpA family protein [Thermonemataceae bacterium]
MKNISFLLIFMMIGVLAKAQIVNPKETAKRKATDRINNKIDQGIDKGLDKVEGVFKKKDKKKKDNEPKEADNSTDNTNTDANGKSEEKQENTAKGSTPSLKAYSKFDFVAGEKVIYFDDYSTTNVGDFPANWNTNASGEIVSLDGNDSKFLKVGKKGIFIPESLKELPENFTVEFDMAVSEDMSEMEGGLLVVFPVLKERNLNYDIYFNRKPQANIELHPVGAGQGHTSIMYVADKNSESTGEWAISNQTKLNDSWKSGKINRISFWRQKTRLRMYINEHKVWDIPKAFSENQKCSMLFGTNIWEGSMFVANLRVAIGQPDTRSKLITEGKLVTRGITFDTGSDKIKPESYGILKEIAQVLSENPSVKVKIVGHTDSDGNAANNLELSKKRAAAVRQALASEFKIDSSRMQTDGKGAAEPSEANTTPQGKANNRRVEFIKL